MKYVFNFNRLCFKNLIVLEVKAKQNWTLNMCAFTSICMCYVICVNTKGKSTVASTIHVTIFATIHVYIISWKLKKMVMRF